MGAQFDGHDGQRWHLDLEWIRRHGRAVSRLRTREPELPSEESDPCFRLKKKKAVK